MPKKNTEELRMKRIEWRVLSYKKVMAERLAKTRKIFGSRVYSVDIHTHSLYSDGIGTVRENYQCAMDSGLDFMFATDHKSIAQQKVVNKLPRASWGQEPDLDVHHIGLLGNKKVFHPNVEMSLLDNLRNAAKLAPFIWIPHPVGWYFKRWYPDKAVAELWEAGDSFAMEIINGAAKMLRAYDQFDAKTVTVWDRLLSDGRKITAVGGSDAHCQHDIGSVWTGVFAKARSAGSIIKALSAGACFASESALLDFSCDDQPLGSVIRKRKGSKLRFRFRVADSAGLTSIRIVSQGRVLYSVKPEGEVCVEGEFSINASGNSVYYRLESQSVDDLRAFSTPVYVE